MIKSRILNRFQRWDKQRKWNYWDNHWKLETRIYHIWLGMKTRCKPNNEYGAKGVIICPEWYEFINFFNWSICNGYADDLSIDRKDNSKGYNPDNCRWATRAEQANNTTLNRKITIVNETKNVGEWLKLNNISWSAYTGRIRMGWDIKIAVTKCMRKKAKNHNV